MQRIEIDTAAQITPIMSAGANPRAFLFTPLEVSNELDGILAVPLDLNRFVRSVLHDVFAEGYRIRLAANRKTFFSTTQQEKAGGWRPEHHAVVSAPTVSWDLHMWPGRQRLTQMRGFAPTVTLFGGGIGTLAAMVMVYLAQVSHHQARALDLTQQRLQSILDSLLEGIYMLDTEGRVTFANPAACQSIGYTMDELKGQPLHDLIHHSHRDGTPYRHDECPVNRVLSTGGSIHVESEVFRSQRGSEMTIGVPTTLDRLSCFCAPFTPGYCPALSIPKQRKRSIDFNRKAHIPEARHGRESIGTAFLWEARPRELNRRHVADRDHSLAKVIQRKGFAEPPPDIAESAEPTT